MNICAMKLKREEWNALTTKPERGWLYSFTTVKVFQSVCLLRFPLSQITHIELMKLKKCTISNFINECLQTVAYWIDFTDIGTEGKWVTLSTGKSEYTRWQSGQPDNYRGNQNCAYNIKGSWDDHSCKSTYQVLCEASGTLWCDWYFSVESFKLCVKEVGKQE